MAFKYFIVLALVFSCATFESIQARNLHSPVKREIPSMAQGIWYTLAEINTDNDLGDVSCMWKNMELGPDGTYHSVGHFKRNNKFHTTDEPEFQSFINKKVTLYDIESYSSGLELIFTYGVGNKITFTFQSRNTTATSEGLEAFKSIAKEMGMDIKYIDQSNCPIVNPS